MDAGGGTVEVAGRILTEVVFHPQRMPLQTITSLPSYSDDQSFENDLTTFLQRYKDSKLSPENERLLHILRIMGPATLQATAS